MCHNCRMVRDWKLIVDAFLQAKPMYPLIIVIGPTASGKTAFSIELAQYLQDEMGRAAEVLNADSRQFYKHLDIGTAKITEDEMQGIPHHLISVLDPREECSIAWFQKEATKTIGDIHKRGNILLLVGGSMLYVSAVIDGFLPISKPHPSIRERLSKEYNKDLGISLFKRLSEVDPETAERIQKENKVYVIRALEIFESTGKPKSAQRKKSGSVYDLLILGIDRPKEELDKRIEERTRMMLDSGWIEEVQGLLDRGYTAEDPAMKSHGYREIMQTLLSQNLDKNVLVEEISRKGKQYAKRHRTWWRGDERVQWVIPSAELIRSADF